MSNFAVMKTVYLDNAATTAMRTEVIEEMATVMASAFGNPSSTHSFGRAGRVLVETARKSIAKLINAEAREIIFTSGGTEADNWIINSVIKDLGVKRIITSKVEHHAVLHTVESIINDVDVQVNYVKLLSNGSIDFNHLEELLQENTPTLVSLIHVNNETGIVLDLYKTGDLCKQYNAWFHTDTIQSIGKTEFDLQSLPVDFLTASAHKFHGPKGVGFAYVRKNIVLKPMIYGGEQEKGLRAGTEAIHQIAGMAKAMELSYIHLVEEKTYIVSLKDYLIEQLDKNFKGYKINGQDSKLFYNIINVLLPFDESKTSMILFNLDMKGIAVSRGSACQSGSVKPSHVLKEMLSESDIKKPSLRVSFSHYNTKDDIDLFIQALKTV